MKKLLLVLGLVSAITAQADNYQSHSFLSSGVTGIYLTNNWGWTNLTYQANTAGPFTATNGGANGNMVGYYSNLLRSSGLNLAVSNNLNIGGIASTQYMSTGNGYLMVDVSTNVSSTWSITNGGGAVVPLTNDQFNVFQDVSIQPDTWNGDLSIGPPGAAGITNGFFSITFWMQPIGPNAAVFPNVTGTTANGSVWSNNVVAVFSPVYAAPIIANPLNVVENYQGSSLSTEILSVTVTNYSPLISPPLITPYWADSIVTIKVPEYRLVGAKALRLRYAASDGGTNALWIKGIVANGWVK